jgi:hypothetical protein
VYNKLFTHGISASKPCKAFCGARMTRKKSQAVNRMRFDSLPDYHLRADLFVLKFCVFFSEPFNASGSVHQFLFTGEKRVAIGANFN